MVVKESYIFCDEHEQRDMDRIVERREAVKVREAAKVKANGKSAEQCLSL